MTETKKFVQMDKYRRVIEVFTLDQILGEELKAKLDKLQPGEKTQFIGTTFLKRLTPIFPKEE